MGQTGKGSPVPKKPKTQVKFAPNVIKSRTKQEPISFFDEGLHKPGTLFERPKSKRSAASASLCGSNASGCLLTRACAKTLPAH